MTKLLSSCFIKVTPLRSGRLKLNRRGKCSESLPKYYHSIGNNNVQMSEFLLRYECGNINEGTVTETNSFQWGNKGIELLKAIDEDTCLSTDDF